MRRHPAPTAASALACLALAGLMPLTALAGDKPAPAPVAKAGPAAKTEKVAKVVIVCEATGSRIRRVKAEDCAKATQPTTNYYEHDLERTGRMETGKSLRDLDPRIQ